MRDAWAAVQLARMKRLFTVLAENADVQPEWERLVIQHNVSDKKVYGARLVALMKAHDVSRILTFNGDDFVRYPGVITISPETVASAEKPLRSTIARHSSSGDASFIRPTVSFPPFDWAARRRTNSRTPSE